MVAAVSPQDKPWWITAEDEEEIASYIEFHISRSRAGIEDDCVTKAKAIADRFDYRGSKVKINLHHQNPNHHATTELAMAAAVEVNMQDKPWWATAEAEDEIARDIEFHISRSRAGIEDDCVTKAKAIADRFDDRGSRVKINLHHPRPQARELARSRRLLRTIKRRSWSKFGEAMEDDASSQVTTTSSKEVLLERPRILEDKVDEPAAFDDPLAMLASKGDAFLMVCRTCGKKGDHWTFRCHFKNIGAKPERCPPFYWPPRCEVCMEPIVDHVMERWREEGHGATILMTNLSKDIRERDLFNLLYRFGLLVHVSLALDKDSESGRKFGIIQFGQREEAEEAISCLHGSKYKGLTLGVEWAIPMPKGADVPPMCPSCMQATENCVRVTNLSEDTGESDLYNLFCSFGSVNRARLFADKKTGSGRQVGIVEFVKRKDAEWCIEFLNGDKYYSRSLIVEGPFKLQDIQRDFCM